MYAIKFEADVHDGVIKIPPEYRNLESRHLEIVALVLNYDNSENENNISLNMPSEEYIIEHWKEFVMNSSTADDYYKSEKYKLDRAGYLMEKYK